MRKLESDIINLNNGYYAVILPNKISFTKKPTKKRFNLKKPTSKKNDSIIITILPSYDCNLRCIYCYSQAGVVKDGMSKELIQDFLDYYSKKFNQIHIRFAGGGEPFKNFKLMKFSINYAKIFFKDVSIHTITNGTFNNSQFRWLKENKSFIRISFDSLAQDFQRPFANGKNSFPVVVKNIKKIINANLPLAVQTIVTSKSVKLMKEIISFLYKLGVKDIKLEPVYISSISRGEENLMIKPKEFVYYFIDLIKFIRKNRLRILIDSSFVSRPSTGFYCTMPEGNNVLTPEGYITSCVEVSKKSELFSDLLFYAQWDKNKKEIRYDENKLKKLSEFHFSKFFNCINCNLKLICKGGCPMRRFWKDKKGISQNAYNCSISKELIPELLKLIYSDGEYAKILMQGYEIKW